MFNDQHIHPRMLVIITQTEDKKRVEAIFNQLQVHWWYQCLGKGTAPSEILDLFGLSGTRRLVTVGIFPQFLVHDIMQQMKDQLRKKGRGIAFSLPLTGIQGGLLQSLKSDVRLQAEKKIKERIEADMAETKAHAQYNVIFVAVAQGYSEEVMEAARIAGTKGGTIIKSLRHHSLHDHQHFGIELQDEQEIVMIVTSREKKKAVMENIVKACGLSTPAKGLVLSLPVDEVMGIEE